MAFDVTAIEDKIDKVSTGAIEITGGALDLKQMSDVMDFAKLMAISGAAVPKYLQGNPGACLAICSRALRWGMDPFAVAEKSYMVINKGEERIAYESQLVHAVITARAPLKSRLRYEIIGEGDERRCRVWGTFKGEEKPHEYTSETLGKLRDARGKNEYGKIKGSPLWETQPEVQLAYSSVRQWARLHASETMLGVYTPEEIAEAEPMDVTPVAEHRNEMVHKLQERRLQHTKKTTRGFDHEHVNREVGKANGVIEGDAERVVETKQEDEHGQTKDTGAGNAEVRQRDADDQRGADDTVAGGRADLADGNFERSIGRRSVAQAEGGGTEKDESEVFPADRKAGPKS